MTRRLFTAAAALVLALSTVAPALAVPPPPAPGNDGIFPGRPLRDDLVGSSNCRVSAYGRVNGKVVIFLPDHCMHWERPEQGDIDFYNGIARTNGGVRIGIWGPYIPSVADNDLTYIILDSGYIPSVASGKLNKIYRGDVPNASNYWEMTHQPNVTDGCQAWVNDTASYTVYENWQRYFTSDRMYEAGWAMSVENLSADGCFVMTNLDWHNGVCCTSGIPVVAEKDKNTLSGMMVGCRPTVDYATPGRCYEGQVGYMYFTSFYEALLDLDAYWDTRGSLLGAKLCTDADC